MRVDANNPDDRVRYEVYLDGTNVTGIVVTADDIANELVLAPRDHRGKVYRRADGTQLEVTVFGPVAIVAKSHAPSLVTM